MLTLVRVKKWRPSFWARLKHALNLCADCDLGLIWLPTPDDSHYHAPRRFRRRLGGFGC